VDGKRVAGLAGGDDEARPGEVGEVVDGAKARAVDGGERRLRVGDAGGRAQDGVVAAADRHGHVDDAGHHRHPAEDLVGEAGLVRRIPAPASPVVAVGS
jgi:hypothetical protein